MKKYYHFSLPISGTCCVTVEAENDEEAVKLFLKDDAEVELNEWNVDWPRNCEELSVEDIIKFSTTSEID